MPRNKYRPTINYGPFPVWLRANLSQKSGVSDDLLAQRLEYESPLFVELLRQGHLPVSIERFARIALLTATPLEQIFPIWLRFQCTEPGQVSAETAFRFVEMRCAPKPAGEDAQAPQTEGGR